MSRRSGAEGGSFSASGSSDKLNHASLNGSGKLAVGEGLFGELDETTATTTVLLQ